MLRQLKRCSEEGEPFFHEKCRGQEASEQHTKNRQVWTLSWDAEIKWSRLFPINTAVEPLNQLGGPNGEGVTYAKESRQGDRSAGLYLLPVASGEAKSNHVFLGKSFGLTKMFYPLSESAKELLLVDQACLLGD